MFDLTRAWTQAPPDDFISHQEDMETTGIVLSDRILVIGGGADMLVPRAQLTSTH